MSALPQITPVVAHFEDLLAHGLRAVIGGDASLEVVADDVAPDRIDVMLRAHRPHVAILNIDALPKLAHVRTLSRQHPNTRLVLLGTRPATTMSAQLLALGRAHVSPGTPRPATS